MGRFACVICRFGRFFDVMIINFQNRQEKEDWNLCVCVLEFAKIYKQPKALSFSYLYNFGMRGKSVLDMWLISVIVCYGF